MRKKIGKSIWKLLKQKFDKIPNEKFKHNLLQAFPFWIASILTGIVSVFYAKGFLLTEQLSFKLIHWHRWIIFIQAPIFFLFSWWLVKRFSPYSKGSGIPQVMASLNISISRNIKKLRNFLGLKVIVVKIVSSFSMVLGGGAIGREGPTIQIAASIFKYVNNHIPKSWPKVAKQNMIVAGAAAGLSAAFNTPLGGLVFTIEELSKTHISFYRTTLFSAVIIAGLTAQSLLGPYLYLGYPILGKTNWEVAALVFFVAILSGLLGSYLAKLVHKIIRWKINLKTNFTNILFVVGCSLIIATLVFLGGEKVMGSGKETMTQLLFFEDKTPEWYLFPVRFIGPLVSFTSGGAGGIFAPGLSAGAALGATVAHWFNLFSSDANLLILVGMVGFLTGITRTPFTSFILVLEMTDRHSVIFYLMIGSLIASIVANLVEKKSLYEKLKEEYIEEVKAS